jgi:hypothetical protein
MNDKKSYINKIKNWILEIQFEFMENELFLPTGLELSCVPIIIETKDDYTFQGISNNSDIDEINYPLAYYKPSTDSIHIFIDHKAFEVRKSDNEKYALLLFLLFHEASHRLLMHIPRQNNRTQELWNIAADYEIHNMYYVFNEIILSNKKLCNNHIHKYMKEYITKFLIEKNNIDLEIGLFDKTFLNDTAEEIYQYLLNSKEEKSFQFKVQNGNVYAKITKYKLPNGKQITTTSIHFPNIEGGSGKSKEQIENETNNALTRKTLLQNTLDSQFKKLKGNLSQESKNFLKKLFHVKIDWKKILRNSLITALEKDGLFSWAKPRTSMFALNNSIYLPSQIETNSSYGTLIVARDESGSISDVDCRKAASIISDAKEYYKQIIVLKHDTKITSIKEFNEMNDDAIQYLLTRDSFGGTSHKEIFEWINDYCKKHQDENKISCCIFITDMISDIENYQDIISNEIPIIYLSDKSNIDSSSSNIKGIKIPIE